MDEILSRFGITVEAGHLGHRLRARLENPWLFLMMARAELRSNFRLPARHALRAWRHGFSRRTYHLYNLDLEGDPRDYLSDWVQFMAPVRINGVHRRAAVQKVLFTHYLEGLGAPCQPVRAVILRGRVHAVREPGWRALLDSSPAIVLKPIVGSEGFGLVFVKKAGPGFEINGRAASESDVDAVISRLHNYMMVDFATQHEYAARLHPRTTNTMRLLTLWDYDAGAPFLAAAVQRIGTSRSYPVDNYRMGAGGVSARVDPESGVMGPGVHRRDGGRMIAQPKHPETGADIEGVRIPRFREIVSDVVGYAARTPYLPLIGWDVVVTPDGFSILEANPASGFFVIQVHGPLRKDPRVQRFFETHGFA